jgi:hypothetical protein
MMTCHQATKAISDYSHVHLANLGKKKLPEKIRQLILIEKEN